MKTVHMKTHQRQVSSDQSGMRVRKSMIAAAMTTGLLLGMSSASFAKGEIYHVNTVAEAASPLTYSKDGIVYQWGQGANLKATSFEFNGKTLDYVADADRVVVRRVDNAQASGKPCAIFAETNGNAYSYLASYPDDGTGTGNCDTAAIMSSGTMNVGALDVFSNAGQDGGFSLGNIERVDFIYDQGVAAPLEKAALAETGHVVTEKHGNNPVKIAAITALDESGNPAAYGVLRLIEPAYSGNENALRYGITNISQDNDFLANERHGPQGYVSWKGTQTEPLGMAFVSLEDLGVTEGQTYYGFSFFAPDVDENIHDLTAPETFPQDTDRATDGDADLFGAAAFYKPKTVNLPPVANNDTALTNQNKSVEIDLLGNDSDPEGDLLTVAIATDPSSGTVNLVGGVATYQPDDGFSGKDSFTYALSDDHGHTVIARVDVSVASVLSSSGTSARLRNIETGLTGAGSMGWMLLPMLLAGLLRRRQQA